MKYLKNGIFLSCFIILVSCSEDIVSDGNEGNGTDAPLVVLAWNDLGMHCLNPTYDTAVILPPYNTIYAQVVRRGNPPEAVTEGITVEYYIGNNTYSYGKRDYGQFWDNSQALFGTAVPVDTGLTGNGLSGEMERRGDYFIIEGIPVTPVNDSGVWNPYQVAVITVKNSSGGTIAQTQATVPVSDEINCSRCHSPSPWTDILEKHDGMNGTTLVSSTPVLCATCHGSPALGTSGPGSSGKYLSEAIHTAHAPRGATCYDCHPGAVTKCMRSERHTSENGNCVTCHGTLTTVGGSIAGGRTPWLDEPACADCHISQDGVDTGTALYRNARGHGNLYCAACHGSPHAMIPSLTAIDNYQALQYQGFTGMAKTMGSCGVCHESSRGEEDDIEEFGEEHGGLSPERTTACNTCHTATPSNTSAWPHGYTWKDSNH